MHSRPPQPTFSTTLRRSGRSGEEIFLPGGFQQRATVGCGAPPVWYDLSRITKHDLPRLHDYTQPALDLYSSAPPRSRGRLCRLPACPRPPRPAV
eukprot:4897019-Prymnesium_polylepis.2